MGPSAIHQSRHPGWHSYGKLSTVSRVGGELTRSIKSSGLDDGPLAPFGLIFRRRRGAESGLPSGVIECLKFLPTHVDGNVGSRFAGIPLVVWMKVDCNVTCSA